MITRPSRDALRRKRHERIRLRISGTPQRPRLSVFRSTRYIYGQVVDDTTGRTLAYASSLEPELRGEEGKAASAHRVGQMLAERARASGVSAVVLDRGGYQYHGRVRSLAEGAREGGLDL
jgi:large subunit ribosomal protein L18